MPEPPEYYLTKLREGWAEVNVGKEVEPLLMGEH